MLVLSRKYGESVILQMSDGSSIEVMVSRIHPDKVRLGFLADENVTIIRKELLEKHGEKEG